MKRKVSIALALMLVLCMICSLFAFVGCDDECTQHVDADGDGLCDNCGAEMPKEPCTEHVDANNDGKCDVCGADMPKDPEPTPDPDEHEHVDANDDGKCDVCGLCLNHRDTNGDGKCDNCDQCMEHRDANKDGKCDNCGRSVINTYAPDNAVKKIVENLTAQYSALAGSYVFGVNFDVTLDRKTSDLDEDYVLRGKASIDLTAANAADKDSALWIELVKKVDGGEETIFGVAMEMTDGEPYMYANIMGEDYVKINAVSIYDLAALAGKTEPLASSLATADGGLDMGEIIESAIYSIIFDGVVEHNVVENTYALEVNVGNTVYQLANLLQIFDLGSLIGISDADIVAVINEIFGQLSYTEDETTVNVEDLSDLLMWVNSKYGNYGGSALVTFDKDNKLVDVTASFNDGESDSIALDLGTLEIGVSEVAVMDNFPMSEAQRSAAEAINLLNFQINGTSVFTDDSGAEKAYFKIAINMDLDPFAFLKLLGGTSQENIMDAIKGLGYLDIDIDKTDSSFAVKEVDTIDIHADFATGQVIAQLSGGKVILWSVGLGGVYDLDALVDIHNFMNCSHKDADTDDICDICYQTCHVADADDDGKCDVCGVCIEHKDANDDGKCDNCSACVEHVDKNNDGKCDNCEACMGHVDANEDKKCDVCGACIEHIDANNDCVCDVCGGAAHVDADGSGRCDKCDYLMSGGIDIVKLIREVMPFIHYEDIATNGVTVEIMDALPVVTGALGIDLSGFIGMLGGAFYDATNMNFKVETPEYGACETREYKDIEPSSTAALLQSVDGIETSVEEGAALPDLSAGTEITISGTNYDGTANPGVTAEILTTIGAFDPELVGVPQTVTLYVSVDNDFMGGWGTVAGIIGNVDGRIPLFGVQKVEYTLTIVPFDEEAEVTTDAKDNAEVVIGASSDSSLFDFLATTKEGYTKVINVTVTKSDQTTSKQAFKSADWTYDILDEEGKVVTDEVVKSGKMTKVGNYTVRHYFGLYHVDTQISVIKYEVRMNTPIEKVALGEEVDLTGKLYKIAADGTESEVQDISVDLYKGSSKQTITSIATAVDGKPGTYTFNMKTSVVGTYKLGAKVSVKVGDSSSSKSFFGQEFEVNIPADKPTIDKTGNTTPKFNQTINGFWAITDVDGTVYTIKYDSASKKLVAVNEDGTEYDKEYSISVKVGDVAATFNDDGIISNFPVNTKAGSVGVKIALDIVADGLSYSTSFTQYAPYVSNITKYKDFTVDSLLDGMATMTYLWYEVDGENVSVNIKYLADEDKYAFVVTETGAPVSYIDFTVTGANDEPVTLTNGKFPAVGEYNVTGTYTINGYEGKLIFSVVVVEPEA